MVKAAGLRLFMLHLMLCQLLFIYRSFVGKLFYSLIDFSKVTEHRGGYLYVYTVICSLLFTQETECL